MPILTAVPYIFSPGTTIYSSQVDADFAQIVSQVNAGAAALGANNDITSLDNATGVSIHGTNTNDDASGGYVGELISASVASGAAVSMTAGAATNIASVSLTAGDWDVEGNIVFNPNSNAMTEWQAWFSTTSATLPTLPNAGGYAAGIGSTSSVAPCLGVPRMRVSLASTTTVYLSGQIASAGAGLGYGFIGCRRVR